MKLLNKSLWLLPIILLGAIIFTSGAYALTVQNFSTNGTFSYVAPSGTTLLFVQTWGAGGGSGGTSGVGGNSGSGGGGAYASSVLSTNSTMNWTVTVGKGGAGGNAGANNGVSGTASKFNFTTTNVTADFGTFGAFAGGTDGASGTGGTTAASFGNHIILPGFNGVTVPAAGGVRGGAAFGGTGDGSAGHSALTTAGGPGQNGYVSVSAVNGTDSIFLLNIFDENTGLPINNTVFTVTVYNNGTLNTYSVNQSAVIIFNNTPINTTATITISGSPYVQRSYNITPTSGVASQINAYMGTSVLTTIFEVEAADGPSIGQPIVNAGVTQERIINGSFQLIDARSTDISGTAGPFSYNATTLYRFTVIATGYVTQSFILNPVQFSSYTIRLISSASYPNFQDYQGVNVFYNGTVFYDSQLNNFTFTISSPTGVLTNYTYNLTYPGGTSAGSGSNSFGSTLSSSFNITGSNILSTVNLTYTYSATTFNGTKTFGTSFSIILLPNATYPVNTFNNICSQDYGLGDLEKAGITAIGAGLFAAAGQSAAGAGGAGVMILLAMYLSYKLCIINLWGVALAIMTGVIFIVMGGDLV